TRVLLLTALALAGPACAGVAPVAAAPFADAGGDPYRWLEDIHSARSTEWVRAHNAATTSRFMASQDFRAIRKRLVEVIDSEVRIPYVERRGDYLYNFWQEGSSPSGVWRRTTLDEYRKPFPEWSVLINFARLDRSSGTHWVFKGAQCLKPKYRRCLVS